MFKRGGLWRERLTVQNGADGAPLLYAAYGSGPKPIISGADLISGWRRTTGALYEAVIGRAPGVIYNVYVDGGAGPAAANSFGSDPRWGLMSAACLPQERCTARVGAGINSTYLGPMRRGSWLYRAPRLYVWLGDNGNPIHHRIEAATRYSAVGGTDQAGDGPIDVTIEDLTLERAGSGLYFYSMPPRMHDVVLRRLTVTQTGTGQVDGGGYLNGIDVRGALGAIRYEHNVISYTGNHGNGINNQIADDSVALANDVSHFNHSGIDCKSSSNWHVIGNRVHDAVLAPHRSGLGASVTNRRGFNAIYVEAQPDNGRRGDGIAGSYPAGGLEIRDNLIWNVGLGGIAGTGVGIQLDRYVARGNRVENNSIYQVQIGIGLYSGGGQVFNNAIDRVADCAIEITPGTAYSEDYNVLGLTLDGSAAAIRNSQGQIVAAAAHDRRGAPGWVRPPFNFALRSNSICLAAGAPSAGGRPNIGAPER
ncbi:MAG TPA: hypothetical protein VKV28_15425 [Candidatus Binataceae bacterium]|nr:hypothetical protein [Candidatus Binataceae bacterium]